MKKICLINIATASLFLGSVAMADNSSDSNADVGQAFAAKISDSQGVIVRVPVNDQGVEMSTGAEMRVVLSAPSSASADAVADAFESGLDASTGPVLDANADSSTDSDSNTNHNSYGWNSWTSQYGSTYYSGYGYSNSYYYNSYRPTYHCGSYSSYSYNYPTYYSHVTRVYTRDGYWQWHPYNYYHYRRGW